MLGPILTACKQILVELVLGVLLAFGFIKIAGCSLHVGDETGGFHLYA
jgi:hypothetical protein